MRLVDADSIPYLPEDIGHKDEIGIRRKNIVQVTTKDTVDNVPTVEAIPVTEKAFEMFETDYENRLKADLKAILVELQLEIDELPNHELQSSDWKQGFTHGLADVQEKVIQKKINELKEKDNGK